MPDLLEPPRHLPGPPPQFDADNRNLAAEFAQPGTVMHFAFRLGYMPNDEADAEAIITRCLREGEWWEAQARRLNGE
jgi:hypothetical protein